MIGFDLVALKQSRQSPHYGSTTYLQKILTSSEIDQWNNWPEEMDFALICWCIKESVYKALPFSSQGRYNPHRISIQSLIHDGNEWLACSETEGFKVWSRVSVSEETLRCTSALSETILQSSRQFCFRSDPEMLSEKMKDIALSNIKKSMGFQVDLGEYENGKPFLSVDGECMDSISFSHDGEFAGFAVVSTSVPLS